MENSLQEMPTATTQRRGQSCTALLTAARQTNRVGRCLNHTQTGFSSRQTHPCIRVRSTTQMLLFFMLREPVVNTCLVCQGLLSEKKTTLNALTLSLPHVCEPRNLPTNYFCYACVAFVSMCLAVSGCEQMGMGWSHPPTPRCANLIWNLANDSMRDFFVEKLIAPLAAAPFIDGVFFDCFNFAYVAQAFGLSIGAQG